MEKPSFENGERHGKAVACPRCQSSNTKFCYFNNHNVNQPRHFCRDCQRYWTAGGSLRNVPVGAGKRKHKGPHAITNKMDNLPNIFCFSGTHLDQGVYTPPLDPPSVLSFKQHVAHSYGESKLSEMPTSVSQKPVGGDRKPPETTTSQPVVSGNCGEMRASETRAFVCLPRSEKVGGFSDVLKKPSQLNLGLTLSKEMDIKEKDAKLPSNSSVPHDFTTSHHVAKQDAPMSVPHDFTLSHHVAKPDARPPQPVNERDESTGCSSVTANLGPSVLEAFAESNTPSTRAPTLPSAEQAPGVLNPMTAWGASMCPPWLWPFIMSGQSVVPPSGVPQVDPTFAAAMGAMASIPPIHPAFAAAMGAMASGGRLPQIDPNMMAALTASFLHLPHLWNPYAWGLPWNAAWNMSNTGVNAPNVINKRPVSPTQEQGCASKILKRDHSEEAAHSTGVRTVEVANAPSFPSAGYFDAFQPKADTYQLKPTGTQESEGHSDLHQHQPPHTNPAAQARSAAFQEGN